MVSRFFAIFANVKEQNERTMTRKNYGYKKPFDYFSEIIYEKETKTGKNGSMGTTISVTFFDDSCRVLKVNWGADIDYEYSRDGEVEIAMGFNKENTQKLMLRTGTHNAADMVAALAQRFKKHGASAFEKIQEFCDEKEIQYSYNVHY